MIVEISGVLDLDAAGRLFDALVDSSGGGHTRPIVDLFGVASVSAFMILASSLAWQALKVLMRLRFSQGEEALGIDRLETGALAYPAPQGPHCCGVGASAAFGRDLTNSHARACLGAGLLIYGTNAEVMPGQREFQIGFRGIEGEPADVLTMADHVWLARFLLERDAERLGWTVSFDNKPMAGAWNGAGMHTSFPTAATRSPASGRKAIAARDQGPVATPRSPYRSLRRRAVRTPGPRSHPIRRFLSRHASPDT